MANLDWQAVRALILKGHEPFVAMKAVWKKQRLRLGLEECKHCKAWVNPKRMARHLRRNHKGAK